MIATTPSSGGIGIEWCSDFRLGWGGAKGLAQGESPSLGEGGDPQRMRTQSVVGALGGGSLADFVTTCPIATLSSARHCRIVAFGMQKSCAGLAAELTPMTT